MRPKLLLSAGEASGDRIAAHVLAALDGKASAFGMGGPATRAHGVHHLAHLEKLSVMGLSDVVARALEIRSAYRVLLQAAREQRPAAALLVGFTSFHQRLGRRLRMLGIPVLWCVAPQVWAWRRSRIHHLRDSADVLAVVLPFEEKLWREHGYDAHYVGHPAVDATRWDDTRLTSIDAPTLGVLCGSRDPEVRAMAPVLLDAAKLWLEKHPGWQVEVVEAPSLLPDRAAFLRSLARERNLRVVRGGDVDGAAPLLHAYALSFCASGTGCLESVLSCTPPVVAYRFDWLTGLAAKALVTTDSIALPNILLGRRVFPEVVQHRLTTEAVLEGAEDLLTRQAELVDACAQVRNRLRIADGLRFGDRVVRLLGPLMASRGGGLPSESDSKDVSRTSTSFPAGGGPAQRRQGRFG